MKILNIVGARPNFMKMAPLIEAMNKYPHQIVHKLVHTGQHYDEKMSKSFFDDLAMPKPDINLGVGSNSHAKQTADIMVAFEKVCLQETPDLVVVVGDVNSTMACTITAKKLGIKVAHVEAGLRSRDISMPEEVNRLCTDVLSDFLFTTDKIADHNLVMEGVSPEKIYFVGNVMIDSLLKHQERAKKIGIVEKLGLKSKEYATLTMHRPTNVDDPVILEGLLAMLKHIAQEIPIVFPIHPRTKSMIEKFGLSKYCNTTAQVEGLWITEPLGYLEFLNLNMNARFVITDSGGLQEETTVLGIPCVTIRNNTERPITCEEGTNVLAGNNPAKVLECIEKIIVNGVSQGKIPSKWDGMAANRIVDILLREMIIQD
jgi:UDP-N-acetylglucosamine 2-epimerase (non-hydrolysing)